MILLVFLQSTFISVVFWFYYLSSLVVVKDNSYNISPANTICAGMKSKMLCAERIARAQLASICDQGSL
jgi:hypothetical protein